MQNLKQDLRYTFRTLRREKGFCAIAVLILALGIGANTAIFSVVNALLFRPLPFRDSARLVWIANDLPAVGLSGVTSRVATFKDWRDMNRSFESLTAYFAFSDYSSYTLLERGEPERLSGFAVVQSFFDVLGLRPEIGRTFTDEESKWHGANAVILSHGLWERRFGSDPKVLGRSIVLNDDSYTVVGVMPQSFDFGSVFSPGEQVDLLMPFPVTPETGRWGNTLAVIGRLKPGVTVEKAQAEFDLLNLQIHQAHPERWHFGARLTALQNQIRGQHRRGLLTLLGAVGVVLLIACANLSNLLLARAAGRRKEIAVRVALGAGRWRLVQQMLTESMALSLCGAALGLALAFAATHAIAASRTFSLPLLGTAGVDRTALLFTFVVALLTGILFGVLPAWQISRATVHDALKESARGSSDGPRGSWLRQSLVVGEVALACMLLVGAGLLIRSFVRVLDVDLGFRPERTAVWRIETGKRYSTGPQRMALFAALVSKIDAVPGVESAGMTDTLPLGRNRSWGIVAKGVTYPPGQTPNGFPRIVDPGYVPAMKIPLRAGRNLTEHDVAGAGFVVVVNENTARTLWPGRDPLGQTGNFGGRDCKVVGVVGNVRHSSLEEQGGLEFYLPVAQWGASSMDMVVRTKLDPAALAPGIRAALRSVDAELPVANFETLGDVVDHAVSPRRFVMLLLGGFAALALLLASLGIYGVVSYSVTQRTREIGVRMALGASASNVRWGVVRQTLILAFGGIAAGIAGSLAAARLLSSLLYGVSAEDPATFVAMIAALAAVAALAGYIPARRASRIDPMAALRME
jgi:predicted permease